MTIYFYRRSEKPYGAFSNFAHYPFELNGKSWATSEHYFQAMKFVGTPTEEEIRTTKSPMDAAKTGRGSSDQFRSDWDEVRLDVMRDALLAKFTQNDDVRTLLLETGDEEIVEKTTGDYYWGCGDDGTGQNWLGKLLMETREKLRASERIVTEK